MRTPFVFVPLQTGDVDEKDADEEEEFEEKKPVDGFVDGQDEEEEWAANAFDSQHWGPERRVMVQRVTGQGLGISIVGGKVTSSSTSSVNAASAAPVTGIFIKNVLKGSPAGETDLLFTGKGRVGKKP